ncbi:mechanosensitive ion channel domain-containing protein [Pontibacter sp. JAM-7]|uniref:mechanosensitive ion channel domain-containing protein n=1 Tax=Pontibacter sp. JAM-7 TaxID=3366581 RepID=UPI003AF6B7ED
MPTLLQADAQAQLEQFQQRLEQLPTEEANPELKPQRERLQNLIGLLQNTVTAEQQITALRTQLNELPQQTLKLQQALKQPLPDPAAQLSADTGLDALEQRLTLAKARQLELQQTQDNLRNQISQNEQHLINLREQLATLKQKKISVSQQADPERYQIEFALRNSKVQAIELELLALPGQNEINQLQREQINRQLTQQQQWVQLLQDRVAAERRIETEAALEQLDDAELERLSPAVEAQQSRNQTLSEQLRTTLASAEDALNQRRRLEAELDIITQSYQAIQQELALSSSPLGSDLRRYTRRLSNAAPGRNAHQQLDQLRLANLEISRSLYTLNNQPAPEQANSAAEQQQLNKLRNNEKILLKRLQDATGQAINELSQLLEVQDQLTNQVQQGQNLIYQHLLWIPSVPAINTDWFEELISGTPKLYSILKPGTQQVMWHPQPNWGSKLTVCILVSIIGLLCLRRLWRSAPVWRQQLGNVIRDRFGHTVAMLALPLLISLPLPLITALICLELINLEAWWDQGLIRLLCLIFTFGLFCYQVLLLWLRVPNGLMCAHFATPKHLCRGLSNRLHYLFWLGMPLVLIIVAADRSLEPDLQSGLGRLAFILLTLLITLFWSSLRRLAPQINELTRSHRWWQQSQVWLPGLVGLHLLMIIAALLGYVYSASMLMLMLLVMVGILVATLLFFRLGNRWLLISERELAFKRAKDRRNEIIEAREKKEEGPQLEENYLDLQTISDQARILLKTATVLLFFLLCWLTLRSALPNLDLLDQVTLWNNTISGPDGSTIISQSITLKNLLSAAVVIILSILAAHNLPGLLELLVLKHLTLSPGTGYAITTVTKYVLIVTAIVAGASQMGLEWSKLQWLIAALGVGLGFGLQEIVANFISGIIILFEKPIRLGDTITIGDYTGTVTKIQIRATTIADWDKKEVIIPNKNFVTDQLINWSLTDPVTRLVLTVGVAYGSDTELTQRLLMEVAQNHPLVLKEPEPNAFFMAFGASTLDFELRVFVSSMADRLPVTHELNQAIDARFKEHGIEIAFPQLDVHMKRS